MSDVEDVLKTGVIPEMISQQRGARRQEARAREVEQRIQDVKSARERRRAIREARVARAEIESGAQATGTATTSGAVSGAGAVGTQLSSNLSFLDTVSELQTQSNIFSASAARRRGRAQDLRSVFDLGVTAAGFAGG